jgi:CRISPR-associated protein Cas1
VNTLGRSLIESVANSANLRSAWENVLQNDLRDGELSRSGERFIDDVDEQLSRIATDLLSGGYQWTSLTPVEIPKSNGDLRRLAIPSVGDRVTERAITQVVNPLVDPLMSPQSFAYRSGVSVNDAIRRLAECRDEGYGLVVCADIDDCFPSLSHELVMMQLRRFFDDDRLCRLIKQSLQRPIRGRNESATCGVPQGGPLSPLLSNVALTALDEALATCGVVCLRYADDLALPVRDSFQGAEVSRILSEEVARLGVKLGDDKSEIMSFDQGFVFLGEEMSSKYPETTVLKGSARPDRRTLMVAHENSVVRIEKGQILVSKDKKDLLKIPSSTVGRIVMFGAVGLSAGARSFAMGTGVPVVFCSRRGSFLGTLNSASGRRLEIFRGQIAACDDPAFALALARCFLRGKISNQRALLARLGREKDPASIAKSVEQLRERYLSVDSAPSVESLMGVEGSAADSYWMAFRHLLPEWCQFEGRRHSPPPDEVNALLSFGYTLLTGEAVSAVVASGLDPGVGVIHAEGNDKPSLALDLMEEFRPLVVDSVVVELLRRNQLSKASFRAEQGRGGFLLTHEGRKIVLAAFEERMLQLFSYPATGKRVSYRRALYLQAQAVSRSVQDGTVDYTPVRWRI